MEIDHKLILDQMPDAMIMADRAGNIGYWNPAAEKIFGFPASEVTGANLDIIIPPALQAAHWRGFELALSSGVTKHSGAALPTKALRNDGSEIYVEMSFSLLIRDGVPEGALACARDITERFQKDRESRRHLRDLEAEVKQLREEHTAEPVQ